MAAIADRPRPETPPDPRPNVEGGEIDVSTDVQPPGTAGQPREGGMLNQAGEPAAERDRRDGGMIGEG